MIKSLPANRISVKCLNLVFVSTRPGRESRGADNKSLTIWSLRASHQERSSERNNGQLHVHNAVTVDEEHPDSDNVFNCGKRAMSQTNCRLEIFVQLKFKCCGWRLTIPINTLDVTLLRVKSNSRQSLGSQHHP